MIDHILHFWFGENGDNSIEPHISKRWFSGTKALDQQITELFGRAWQQAVAGELDDWLVTPRGRLALVVLVDQMGRNIHRGTAAAFLGDELTRQWLKQGLATGQHFSLAIIERSFFYMPLQHSELLADQLQSVALFEQLLAEAPGSLRKHLQSSLDYARHHAEIIERFNRFPHRNAVLGRESSNEERDYLANGGARFGQ